MSISTRYVTIDGVAHDRARFVERIRQKDPVATRRLVRQLRADQQTRGSEGLRVVAEAFGREVQTFIARLTRRPNVAAELVEEVLERVFTRVDRYDPTRSAFRTWVYEQARYTVIEWAKRQARHREEPADNVEDLHDADDAASSPDDPSIGAAERAALRRAMRKLKPTQRELLWWVEVLGLRPVEVARAGVVGDVPENQIKVYVWRARRALQAAFEAEIRRSQNG